MEKSNTISELAKALNKFQSMMGIVVFDAANPFFKSKYATLSAIVSTSKPILADCGLSISQLTEGDGGVTTILMHISGEYLMSTLTLKSVKDDPQAHGSAITYARRYSYASILGIVSDQDDDGNACSYEPKKTPQDAQKHASEAQGDTKTTEKTISTGDDDFITKEQGEALMLILARNGYFMPDLKTMISWEFNLDSPLKIKNYHLPKIKEYFSKKKEVVK
jgi:hypothetical protein